ncbi:unnamed protein product [Hyaloperonospora brassicae]|uniref:Uncharacterized protein n=1 Tax=Hyaloperonospora brassicae TaxID=162125 RepID=A0AAV0TVN2_HYABA|nr:unnamed protein product [Hyaloperonospora brassicae]
MAQAQLLSAAEKRAARRARVLQGSASRLQLVTGQITALAASSDASSVASSGPKAHSTDVDEAVDAPSDLHVVSPEAPVAVPTPFVRVDQVQRRRDAAARRRQQQAKSHEETRGGVDASEPRDSEAIRSVVRQNQLAETVSSAERSVKSASLHGRALTLFLLEEKLVLLLIIATALYAAVNMDVRSIMANMATTNDLVDVSYDDLLASGVPVESIRHQLERGHGLSGEKQAALAHLQKQEQQAEMDALATTGRTGWLPDVASLGGFWTSMMAHPPVVLAVFLVRLLVSTGAKAVHKSLGLPDVKHPEESDLGFLVNMALSNRPVLKEFLVKGRKSLDDLFVFLFALVMFVAVRVIWLSY